MNATTAISKIQLGNAFKNYLYSSLQNESPDSKILLELSGGQRQKLMNDLVFKKMNGILAVHDRNQDKDLDLWRIVVLDNFEIKEQVVRQMHNTPYSARPGIQRTIAKVRKSFLLERNVWGRETVRRKLPCVSDGEI